ncbi:hypothetical protein CEUSTIGMA_g5369.t1 [Chlamydomonas eustigma]|uniref:RNI-like protein n=1 Tax=Chlamydomonas eustigma TaxID=1157962 RepID=A0A250X4B6_9CHLO|nr:hypothetical protein CEUSTIGMA_g5369.t1 [Chlamydomonas eustigma]|eukprot:GAX77927.1 hypothetical protein CEUSTIGMA_g5369.t1 [Chlamydomonas eustigma]
MVLTNAYKHLSSAFASTEALVTSKALPRGFKLTKLTLSFGDDVIQKNFHNTLDQLQPSLTSLSILSGLYHLDLTGNRIGPKGAAALATSLVTMTELQHLDLGNNCLGSEGTAAHLNLGRNNNLLVKGATALAPALKALTQLHHLDLSNTNYNGEGPTTWEPHGAIAGLTELQDLNLYGNSLGSQGAIVLAPALLKANVELLDLNLGLNYLGPLGAAALAPSLKHLTKLQHLCLIFNGLGSEGAHALAPCIRRLKGLQVVKLRPDVDSFHSRTGKAFTVSEEEDAHLAALEVDPEDA